ncbi:hypothetical protein [Streptomyces sp. S1D4-20]|uniref:hypothetical protein n=1 Tax=Streptomyces sp. S1D4-20 TaxID=2594462 RepID=UPI0011639B6A|nr:hypothetical protein [Streptomyces sp. S1D4-20]QDN54152.1 hypothetical protein FNV67_00830 [Streptomyces sp. S1D4-20]
METSDPLATFAVQRADALLTQYAGPGPCTTERWHRVLTGLQSDERGVVPRDVPADAQTPVLTFRTDSEPFGPLVDAAARLAHHGGCDAAHQTAEAARTVKVLTTVPRMRYHRPPPLAADAGGDERLWHRVDTEGNGFLPLTVGELTAALGGLLPDRGLLPRPAPSDPKAWVVVWRHLTAPALVLTGVWAATTFSDESGTDWLMRSLQDAAKAMEPGPGACEWKDRN